MHATRDPQLGTSDEPLPGSHFGIAMHFYVLTNTTALHGPNASSRTVTSMPKALAYTHLNRVAMHCASSDSGNNRRKLR